MTGRPRIGLAVDAENPLEDPAEETGRSHQSSSGAPGNPGARMGTAPVALASGETACEGMEGGSFGSASESRVGLASTASTFARTSSTEVGGRTVSVSTCPGIGASAADGVLPYRKGGAAMAVPASGAVTRGVAPLMTPGTCVTSPVGTQSPLSTTV
ncbi:hypothetical protein EBBID32_12430 [Sphingobium indicum BiD32]|uniref:Uncharacterized protein n=1 Tax=Sphingobium indicum BiD32 TaxID=1301087 RepID=N1MJG3_9SPHN|nr:hypothetical protein EBBID32_12430 [Sphingobium indicum BiD32]